MSLKDFIASGANVSVTVNLEDLRELFKEVSVTLKPSAKEKEPEEFLSRKEVLGILKIDSSTLWNWERTGYIKSYPFGGRKRYRLNDVEQIRTGRKSIRYEK